MAQPRYQEALRRPQFLSSWREDDGYRNARFDSSEPADRRASGPAKNKESDTEEMVLSEQNKGAEDSGPETAQEAPQSAAEDTEGASANERAQPIAGEVGEANAKDSEAIPKSRTRIAEALLHPGRVERSDQSGDCCERLSEGLRRLEETRARLEAQARTDAMEIACMIAKRIVEKELKGDVETLLRMVRSAIRMAGDTRVVSVRLSPKDYEAISERTDSSASVQGGLFGNWRYVADPTLSGGDIVVETDFGYVDGRLDQRLENARRVVLGESEGEV